MSDCKEHYTSDVDECHQLYDRPDDADELQLCVSEAKDKTTGALMSAAHSLSSFES
jgi:hypothetical protein